ncbi:TIGR02444 family protein [Brevundimonas sp.]|uniref:TIGR02444 family protein n=1 Tax=Brevundimonas sp. TaxID=1871086 RepID=UPI00391CCFA6
MSDGFWDWAVAAYAAHGVAEECLHLQDVHDQVVPLLLWAAWQAETGRKPDEDAIEGAVDTTRVWADHAVVPLRELRRALKTRRPDMADPDREAVRAQVKAVELEAERRLMLALEVLAPAPAPGGKAPATVELLVRVAREWGDQIPRPALGHLADALAKRLPA